MFLLAYRLIWHLKQSFRPFKPIDGKDQLFGLARMMSGVLTTTSAFCAR